MKTETLFSSASTEWATPQWLFDELDDEFHFTLDVCATPENAKCKQYFTKQDDALAQEWAGVVWCNPPYSRKLTPWVKKAYESAQSGATVVMLLFARTDTQWFHEYIYNKAEIRFIKGRLRFNDCGQNAPAPSMIVVFRGKGGDAHAIQAPSVPEQGDGLPAKP